MEATDIGSFCQKYYHSPSLGSPSICMSHLLISYNQILGLGTIPGYLTVAYTCPKGSNIKPSINTKMNCKGKWPSIRLSSQEKPIWH